ncbi:MAG: polyphosphate kinase 1 [Rhodospirillales bacterium]|nr:polyphosphate kinase 1 [Rhodospirillales bacterium]
MGADIKTAPVKKPVTRKKPAVARKASIAALHGEKYYLNRELTWLKFNFRVLDEARNPKTPLLEKLKFVAIVSSNLDEFFMKRIGGLKQQVGAGVHTKTRDGRTPDEQIDECLEVVKELNSQKRTVYFEVIEALKKKDIVIAKYDELDKDEQSLLREEYYKNIFPLVTPLAMDSAHPFPFLSNLSLNLMTTLQLPDEDTTVQARVKVPVGGNTPRFIRVGNANKFVPLEQIMANNLDLLFPGMDIVKCEIFRVTRNANTERDEEQADDLLAMIETELRDRKFATTVRLEVENGFTPVHQGMLASELGLDEDKDVYTVRGMLGMADLMEVAFIDVHELHDPDHHPINNVKLIENRSIFHTIRDAGSILMHHPYESFSTSVERFLREASVDPKVMAIKVTLYRTSSDSQIIRLLVDAAQNGKEVAVVVELKARFDEAANIKWATRLEEAGIHVNYGVVGLKTHSKVILVVRRDYSGLRRYAHIGTGNYHSGTARLYGDLGLLTCDPEIGADLTELFNYLTTGYKPTRRYNKILAAPKMMKHLLLEKIEREIEHQKKTQNGHVRLKTNALQDSDIIHALYRASQAGVKIELVVRDTCCLIPGLPGASENISVISIVGRFLEHTRIYHFANNGDPEYYIGSADLMSRNLQSRVEVLTPVEDLHWQSELCFILDSQINDHVSGWVMQSDGEYIKRNPSPGQETQGCQQLFVDAADKRNWDANRLKKRRPRAAARRKPR